jgi:ribosomal protein S18 acetylase RimI-like enzyme
MHIDLAVRDLEPADLPDLDWSGGAEHVRYIAEGIGRAAAGEIAQLVVLAGNGQSVGFGAVDFTVDAAGGRLWMLSVRESWQSLGIGTLLIGALEERVLARGRRRATLGVEHDNPRARDLYLRLGYRPYGSALDSWRVGGGRTYVTVTDLLAKNLMATDLVPKDPRD